MDHPSGEISYITSSDKGEGVKMKLENLSTSFMDAPPPQHTNIILKFRLNELLKSIILLEKTLKLQLKIS